MAKPNSFTTVIRNTIVKLLDPYPDAGEAWCIDCSKNNGLTLVLPESGATKHLEGHAADEDWVKLKMSSRTGRL